MFWSEDCKNLSEHLWKPDLFVHHKPKKRKKFKCLNKNISFNYYSDEVSINSNIKFKDMPVVDNSDKKEKEYGKLFNKEFKRFDKELNNKNSKLKPKQMFEKHLNFVNKIDYKVERLDDFIRSKRIQIFPNKSQKIKIHHWIRETTMIYNKLVTQFNMHCQKLRNLIIEDKIPTRDRGYALGKLLRADKNFPLNFIALRNLKGDYLKRGFNYTPCCVKDDIIAEFVHNANSCVTKLIKRQITDFELKHRKIKRTQISIPIQKKYTYETGFYKDSMGPIKIIDPDFEWSDIAKDYKLIYEKYTRKYYIHVPYYLEKREQIERNPIAIMDPGERTFQTLYGLDHVIFIGENIRPSITKRLFKIDELISKLNSKKKTHLKKTKVRKRNYKRAIDRHHRKLKHLADELHWKTALYLCENYDRIMVTDFSSKKVSSKGGDLNKTSKRVLQKVSHYRFRQRLKTKCEEYGCQYLEVSERYTSKTCCNCGNINENLGDSKTYACPKCPNHIHRDINGAINIFLKNHKEVLI
jgi:IS605 OrfB family transposase